MRTGRFYILLLAVSWMSCAVAQAQSTGVWRLTRGDLSRQTVRWIGLNDRGVAVAQAGSTSTIPWDQFVEIQRPAHPSPATAPVDDIVSLRNGDHLHGWPMGIEGETLQWNAAALGRISIALTRITDIRRSDVPALEPGGTPPTQDQAFLANGDQVNGITVDLTDQTLTLQVKGESVSIPVAGLRRLRLAAVGESTFSATRALRMTLTNGSRLTLAKARLDGERLQWTLLDGTQGTVQRSNILAIEQINGPICRVSSLKPIEAVQTSQFSLSWPARMNTNVTGGPIHFGATAYAHGIGVHAYSRLVFKLPEGYRTFRTQYAMDGRGRLADVDVRILLDGKPAYEQAGVRAGQLSPVIELPIQGVQLLTLEVGPGANGDAQDHLNWIHPVLMRQAMKHPATEAGK